MLTGGSDSLKFGSMGKPTATEHPWGSAATHPAMMPWTDPAVVPGGGAWQQRGGRVALETAHAAPPTGTLHLGGELCAGGGFCGDPRFTTLAVKQPSVISTSPVGVGTGASCPPE